MEYKFIDVIIGIIIVVLQIYLSNKINKSDIDHDILIKLKQQLTDHLIHHSEKNQRK